MFSMHFLQFFIRRKDAESLYRSQDHFLQFFNHFLDLHPRVLEVLQLEAPPLDVREDRHQFLLVCDRLQLPLFQMHLQIFLNFVL
jgi:hypothetical protein